MRDIKELNDHRTGILCKTKEESEKISKMLNRPCMFDDYTSDEDYKDGVVYTKHAFCFLNYYKKKRNFTIYNASEFLTDENPGNKFFWGTPNKLGSWVNAGESDKPSQYYSFFTVNVHYLSDISTNFQNSWWMYLGPLPDYENYVPKEPEFVLVSIKDLIDNPPKYVMIRDVKKEYRHVSFFDDCAVITCEGDFTQIFNKFDKVKVIHE